MWRFGRRGLVPLRTLQLKSRFPFGWLERRLVLPAPAEVVVYPRLTAATGAPSPGQDPGVQREAQATRGGGGDFQGLRTYQAGDRLGAVHWPTSARVGELMVVQRGGEAEPALRVVVTATPPDAWELEIARAAGEVHRGFTRGWRVGLEVPSAFGTAGSRWPSRGGAAWRRSLLEALSMLPEAP